MASLNTLPDMLSAVASRNPLAGIYFLDSDSSGGEAFLSYNSLFTDSITYACRLREAGLGPTDIVLACFSDHEHHIRLFWACCLAGIRYCPLPALHPDTSRQALLFEHFESLFNGPTLIATGDLAREIRQHSPNLTILIEEQLPPVSYRHLPSVYPTYCSSPADIVCLMLTSGSTGSSKAVALRHSNLLSSIRGKMEHHSTTSQSRFLNWIAFDHVACVTEVHLHAIQAGASQWHIPSSSIIRDPSLLLRLSSLWRITYTFSPNFLIAQILRDTRPQHLNLSPLTAFISGGEAVPIATAIAFADLLEGYGAPRNALRAGFGMSETSAGCAYDTRPIPRTLDPHGPRFISLGKCCRGLEMRVWDPTAQSAASPNSAGLLQVRGLSLFSHYFNNPSATTESFSNDGWFTTGDLATIDENGNLHLVGREKDCIIINGVKYIPQDMMRCIEDGNVPGVMSGYVFVCPMRLEEADTETYAVFYQHEVLVENEMTEGEKAYIRKSNAQIHQLATIFCSAPPHIILPLPRPAFLKTSLGKVSGSQLVKSFLRRDYDALHASLQAEPPSSATDLASSPLVDAVVHVLEEIFHEHRHNFTLDDNLFQLGASSMHLLRLKQSLQDRLSITHIPTIELLRRPVLRDLCSYLQNILGESTPCRPESYNPIVCLQSSGTKSPLFLIHPGVGEILVFLNLARELADDRPIYALRAKGFEQNDTPFQTFQSMIDCYVNAIEDCYSNGPYFIAGYSFGGVIAFEVTKLLERRGKRIAFLGILNLPPHIQFRMEELTWSEVLINLCVFLSLFPQSQLNSLRQLLAQKFPNGVLRAGGDDDSECIRFLLSKANQTRIDEMDLRMDAFAKWVQVAYAVNRTGRDYVPQDSVGAALTTVLCAVPLQCMGTRSEFKTRRLSEWTNFVRGEFEMVDVDGEHYTMLAKENVPSFAERLRESLHRAEVATVLK